MNTRTRNVIFGLCALAALDAVACFRPTDPSKIKCLGSSSCPAGYYCSMDSSQSGYCVRGSGAPDVGTFDMASGSGGHTGIDAIGTDAGATGSGGTARTDAALGGMAAGGAIVGGSGGSGGTSSPDGPKGTGGTTSTTDVPGAGGTTSTTDVPGAGGTTAVPDAASAEAPGLPNGAACTADGQCRNGFCTDGHCCDDRCDGTCESCATGTCSFTSSPRKACNGTGSCAGVCDKTNPKSCTYPDSQTVCAAQSCSGGELKGKAVCDGLGNCPAQSKTPCDSNLCLADGSDCSGSCAATSCGAGRYCAGSTCAPLKNQGDSCSDKSECSTGFCVDGYCCESGCTGTCTTCAATHGKCTNTTAPRTGKSCGGTAPCNATCTGSSPECVPASTSTPCGTASCLNATTLQLAGTCNSQGTCSQNTQTCTLCLASTNACADCSPTTKHCSATGVPQHCDNTGHWVNDTACGTCRSCALGVCEPVSPGTACTGGVCSSAGTCTPCTQGASCTTGIGECQTGSVDCSTGAVVCNASNKAPGTACGSGPVCSAGTLYPHQVCNNNGQCYTPNGSPCTSGQCSSASACLDCTPSSITGAMIQVYGTTPICSSASPSPGSVSLAVSGGTLGTGARWVWYASPPPSSAGNGVGTGTTLNNVRLASTTTYYARLEGTCGITSPVQTTIQVYTPPVVTVTPSSRSVDCSVAYVGWTNFDASLCSTCAPYGGTAQWYYTTEATDTKTICDTHYFQETTTLHLRVSPQVNQTDWVLVTDACGSQAWGSATLTVPPVSVCFP